MYGRLNVLALLTLFFAGQVAADWQRRILTPKGEQFDTPAPHPLGYFTLYPSLRDEDHNFCYACPLAKSLALAKRRKDRAKVRLIGRIRGFAIYDVLYYFDGESAPSWKSILVRTQPGRYREIWHYQRNEGEIWPSFLVKAGGETLLGLEDDCYRQETVQDYYWFDENGPMRVDFGPIWRAADTVLPKDTYALHHYDGRIDIPAGRLRLGVIEEPQFRCCSDRGVVEVTFRLKGGRIAVTRTRFDPVAEFRWGDGCR